jgi:site-specific recombinase XerC
MTSTFSIADFGRSFERHLRAARKSPRTVQTYMEAMQLLSAFLDRQGDGRTLLEAKRADIEAFLVSLHERCTPATVANRYRSLRRFYGWLEEEEEIPVSPMAKMNPPAVPEQPVPVLPDDALQRLLAVCIGKGFEERRDTAITMVLLEAGPRLAEVAGLRVKDIDFHYEIARVIGKGNRERASRSAGRRFSRSTATSASAPATPTRTWSGCGSAGKAA